MVGARKQQLRGREDAIALVRDFVKRELKFAHSRSREVPVLEFTGERGSGKTALLEDLDERLDGNVPHAFIDFEHRDGKHPYRLLIEATGTLGKRCGQYGRLRFPRLEIWHRMTLRPLPVGVPEDLEQRVLSFLLEEPSRSTPPMPSTKQRMDPTKLSITNIVSGNPQAAVSAGVLNGNVHFGNQDPSPRRHRRKGPIYEIQARVLRKRLRWYSHQDRRLNVNEYQLMENLNHWMTTKEEHEDGPDEAIELLFAAFLADLREAFRTPWALSRTLNCTLLLDNVDAPPGHQFVKHLINARRQHAVLGDTDPDPLTAITTSREVSETSISLRDANYGHYRSVARGPEQSDVYPVQLPDLAEEVIGNMVADLALSGGSTRRITAALYRFTEGHPGTTQLMLEALPRVSEPDDLPAVLRTPVRPEHNAKATTIGERVLHQFLSTVEREVFQDLVTCSAGGNLAQALRLADSGLLISSKRQRHEQLFTSELWSPAESSGSAVLKPVLRRLLLRELAARAQDHPASWRVVHESLRQDANGDQRRQLHHALALEEVEHVTGQMAQLLRDQDVTQWLDLLYDLTAAPNKLDHQHQQPAGHVDELTRWANSAPPPTAPLARLIVALWIDHDPLFPRDRLSDIAWEFLEIAPHSLNGHATLRKESKKYADLAAQFDRNF